MDNKERALLRLKQEVEIQIGMAKHYKANGYTNTARSYMEWSHAIEHAIKLIEPILAGDDET